LYKFAEIIKKSAKASKAEKESTYYTTTTTTTTSTTTTTTTCSQGRRRQDYLQLRAYLQTRDWILLQSMSLNRRDYGWTLGVHGYEPVPTLDPMASEELLKFTS